MQKFEPVGFGFGVGVGVGDGVGVVLLFLLEIATPYHTFPVRLSIIRGKKGKTSYDLFGKGWGTTFDTGIVSNPRNTIPRLAEGRACYNYLSFQT